MTPTQVLYVGGWGRSGSTLLAHMLDHLPGYVSVGELRYVWQGGVAANELCGCGQPFAHCEFWQAVGERAFGGWDAIDVHEVLELEASVLRHRNVPALAAPGIAPGYAERFRRYSELTQRLYAAIAEVAGARAVVDSTKNPPYAYFLRRVAGLDVRVVHLVRDSRGAAFSWMKRMVRPEITDAEAHFQEFSPAGRRCAGQSATWLSNCCAGCAHPPCGCATSRWPHARRSCEPVLGRLDPGAHDLSFLDSGEVEVGAHQHSIRGNPMRFEHGRQRVRVDDAWRTQMRAGAVAW